ncbi:response regulator [Pseudidiomarina insulisalsae]|uniref:Two-component system response regulator n=1 Tax=Pseudidiomarina insulisalsae TaxID=575789 RepID=A0A432YEX5_9GAMM|nr:response regulator [Pseudidiomarina insulisalsae]RUO59506.1 two-component system response regulator [Pseudidiomarina insulisalsae]
MSRKLLLVEDKPATRDQLLAILAETPFVVSYAQDGLEGLNKAKAEVFDVILADHKMPLLDGMNLLRNLRSLASYKQTPLLLMSTQDIKHIEDSARRSGADLCLAKPIEKQRLLGLLADLWQTMHPQTQRNQSSEAS